MRYMLIGAAMLAAIPGAVLADDGNNGSSAPVPAQAPAPAPAPVWTPSNATRSDQPHFGLSFAGAFEFGGDDLATVQFTDGSTENIYAGQGFLLSVGGNYRPTRYSPWDLSLLAGYKIDQAGGDNGDVSFDHIPLELIGTYRWSNKIFVGAGPVYHVNVEFKGSGALGSAPDIKYNNAFGGQIQAGWSWLALTYTFINYDPSQALIPYNGGLLQTKSISGNNFGVRFFYNF